MNKNEQTVPLEEFLQLLPDVTCRIEDDRLTSMAILPVDAINAVLHSTRQSHSERASAYRDFRGKTISVRSQLKELAKSLQPNAKEECRQLFRDVGEWIEALLLWVQYSQTHPWKIDELQALTERRDSLIDRFLALQNDPTNVETEHDKPPQAKHLKACELKGYQSYEFAVSEMPTTPKTDQEAYDWLKDHGYTDEYPLPSPKTWKRYVGAGRKAFGTQKNTPVSGRTGRSICRPDQI